MRCKKCNNKIKYFDWSRYNRMCESCCNKEMNKIEDVGIDELKKLKRDWMIILLIGTLLMLLFLYCLLFPVFVDC